MTCGDPGVVQSLGEPLLLQDQVTVSVALLAPAPKGTCTVSWRVTDTNLQPAGSNSFSFAITNDTAVTVATTSTTVAGPPPTRRPSPRHRRHGPATTGPDNGDSDGTTESSSSSGPLGLFRLISNLGLAMLFGALVVIAVAWPEGVEYILTVRHLRTAWGMAVVGTFLYRRPRCRPAVGRQPRRVAVPTGWVDLLDTTRARPPCCASSSCSPALRRHASRTDHRPRHSALALGAARPGSGHAGVQPRRVRPHRVRRRRGARRGHGRLARRAHPAHPGGARRTGRGRPRARGRGFARISTPALWATVASGAILLFRLDRGDVGLHHGLVLIVKTLFVSIMVFVGVAARQFINQRVTRVDTMTAPLATRLRRALGIEAIVGIVVLVLTSWLLALTPPGLSAGGGSRSHWSDHRVREHGHSTPTCWCRSPTGGHQRRAHRGGRSPRAASPVSASQFLPPVGVTGDGMIIDPIPLTGAGLRCSRRVTGSRSRRRAPGP